MDQINGYPLAALREQLIGRMKEFTASSINQRLAVAERELDAAADPIFVSIGENCAAAAKLREAGLNRLGAHYFDNLVTRAGSVIRLLDEDFGHTLLLRNLVIARWENQDSVFDQRYGVFFHHYFHLRDMDQEKSDFSEGARRRRIDEEDIPLFLPAIQAQFEYLAAKMRLVLRSPRRKVVVLRLLSADPAPRATTAGLLQALYRAGGRHVGLIVVHARPLDEADHELCDTRLHRLIAEDGVRWGPADRWRQAFADET